MDERVFREALCRMQLFGGVNKKTNRLKLVFFATRSTRNAIFYPAQQNNPVRIIGTGIFFLQEALGGMQLFCLAQQKIPVP